MSNKAQIQTVDAILKVMNKNKEKIAMLLVLNLQSDSIEDQYTGYSITSSYSSDIEIDEFVLGLKNFVSYVDVSYGEKEFVEKLSAGMFENLWAYKKIVYTDSASGSARSKSALIPALCDNYGFAYCSNDIFTSALLDNKMGALGILQSFDFPLPNTWIYYHKMGWIKEVPTEDRLLIAKPAYECASIGISSKSVSKLNDSFINFIHDLSLNLKQPILVQEFISGYEVEIPVFDLDQPFTPGAVGIGFSNQPRLGDKFFTYDMIFEDGFNLFDFRTVSEEMSAKLMDISRQAYSYLQLKGPVRFDYRVDDSSGNCFLMDFNNSPHLGRNHSFAYSFKNLGYSYEDMLKTIVYPAICGNL